MEYMSTKYRGNRVTNDRTIAHKLDFLDLSEEEGKACYITSKGTRPNSSQVFNPHSASSRKTYYEKWHCFVGTLTQYCFVSITNIGVICGILTIVIRYEIFIEAQSYFHFIPNTVCALL